MQIHDIKQKIQELGDLVAKEPAPPPTPDQALLQLFSSIERALQSKQFSDRKIVYVTGSAAFKEENKTVTILIDRRFVCGKPFH